MSRKSVLPILCLATALLGTGVGHAEDIDLYLGESTDWGGPNILFVIDNGASWEANIGASKANIMVHRALHTVATHPSLVEVDADGNPVIKANVGMMVFSKSVPDGGKVLMHVQGLTPRLQQTMSCRIYKTDTNGDGICDSDMNIEKNNNTPHAQSFNEAYLYFKGSVPRSGTQDGVYHQIQNTSGYDPAAISGGAYNSPAAAHPCVDNYIIFIGTGTPDSGDNTPSQALLTALGGVLSSDPIALDPESYQQNWSDEFARYLAHTDLDANLGGTQAVKTYTVDVFDPNVNQTRSFLGARAYFKSIAKQGGGEYYAASDADDVVTAILDILNKILSENSVFASVSMPISVNVQGANLNQVYIGMFRPGETKVPRWVGNLKRYQYLFDADGNPYMADMAGNPAYDASEGFISPTAISYWTSDSTYWTFEEEYDPSDSPDGDVVEKGATAQRLRERSGARSLKTCSGTCDSLVTFDTSINAFPSGATITTLDGSTTYTNAQVTNWAIGQDVLDENENGVTTDMRPSIHGDVLHSRPATVNYNRYGNDEDIVVFYGANDGFFRAVAGSTGEELWGFVAPEHYPVLAKNFVNAVPAEGEVWRKYAIDGNASVISLDVNQDGKLVAGDGDKVYLYLTMRRGGRMIYAFDVSTPESPSLMWRKTPADVGYGELGQTWSTPVGAYVSAYRYNNNKPKPVLIFGLGYDPVEDNVEPLAASRTMGRGILVVDALTGAPLWQAGPNPTGATVNKTVAGMTYAIPSDLRVLNRDGDVNNYADTIYVGDTGGNVWRVDMTDTNMSNWSVTQLASVGGCAAGGECRKFLYPPSVVFGTDFDAVMMGTGDREKPVDVTATNRFYMFKDTRSGSAIAEGEMLDVTATPSSVDASQLSSARGWFFTLAAGEKVVGTAITLAGITTFNTHLPPEPNVADDGTVLSCVSDLGEARQYYVSYLDATIPRGYPSRYQDIPGGGLAPAAVAATLIDPATGRVITDAFRFNSLDMAGDVVGRRVRTFWYKRTE